MTALVMGNYSDIREFMPSTRGMSDPARYTEKAAFDVIEHYTATLINEHPLERILDSLSGLLWDCSEANWDGYGANRISEKAVNNAMLYLSLLSKEIPVPEVSPEPDGEVALEWFGSDGSVLSLSFGNNKLIRYAGVFSDESKVHGVERIDSEDKKIIEGFIKKTTSG